MQRVSMVDLVFGPEEENAVLQVLRSGRIAQGPVVEELEGCFAAAVGTRQAVAVSSGTASLRLALQAAGIGERDLVVVPALTFAASLNAALDTGAAVLLADVDRHGNLDLDRAPWLDDPRVVAVMPVHLYGRPVDMAALMTVAGRRGMVVVEDAAQAIGARIDGRSVGSFGIGSFSLYATKNVTTGEGGVITTDDDRIAEVVRSLRAQGSSRRYEYDRIGSNHRLTDLQAAIGVPQMHRLEEITKARHENAMLLSGGLAGLEGLIVPEVDPGTTHAFHQYTIRITLQARRTRSEVIEGLDADGIDSTIVYPRPLHGYAIYRDHPRVEAAATPMADRLAGEVLSLPVHPRLTGSDLERVVSSLRRSLG
jgi:dTDP-4-amino-4,6-dideoxygalactose transaminase